MIGQSYGRTRHHSVTGSGKRLFLGVIVFLSVEIVAARIMAQVVGMSFYA